jgi:crotonobetainyl-CoA hydratase/dehydration protein DpgD
MESDIIFNKKGHTAYVILNRPKQKNAINLAVRQGLCEAWEEINNDSNIRSVIITGGEKMFSTGQDLVELSQFRTKEPIAEMPLNTPETFGADVTKPVISAISGYCLGAGFLLTLLAGDVRIASNTAKFGMPEINVGVPPAFGIPPILASHFSPAIVSELLMFGNNITAEDAYRSGFLNKVVLPEELLSTAEKYANKINKFSPLIIKNIKNVIKNVTAPDHIAIAYSDSVCLLGRHSEDYIEGPKAFREKREPVWKSR